MGGLHTDITPDGPYLMWPEMDVQYHSMWETFEKFFNKIGHQYRHHLQY